MSACAIFLVFRFVIGLITVTETLVSPIGLMLKISEYGT